MIPSHDIMGPEGCRNLLRGPESPRVFLTMRRVAVFDTFSRLEETPDRKRPKGVRGGFIVAYSLRGYSPSWQGRHSSGRKKLHAHTCMGLGWRDGCCYSLGFLLSNLQFHQGPGHMGWCLPLRVDIPSSANPFSKCQGLYLATCSAVY